MRPFVRLFLVLTILAGVSGCTTAVAVGSVAWVGTEALDDKTPFDYGAQLFERNCANMTIYDQPPRCRR